HARHASTTTRHFELSLARAYVADSDRADGHVGGLRLPLAPLFLRALGVHPLRDTARTRLTSARRPHRLGSGSNSRSRRRNLQRSDPPAAAAERSCTRTASSIEIRLARVLGCSHVWLGERSKRVLRRCRDWILDRQILHMK